MVSDRLAPSGGAFALFEEEIPEGAGPPLDIHETERELCTVLSGRVRFACDGVEAEAGPGRSVLIPPVAPHAFKGLGPGPARVLILLSPGHGAGFFCAVEAEGLGPGSDPARLAEIAARYGIAVVGPPL